GIFGKFLYVLGALDASGNRAFVAYALQVFYARGIGSRFCIGGGLLVGFAIAAGIHQASHDGAHDNETEQRVFGGGFGGGALAGFLHAAMRTRGGLVGNLFFTLAAENNCHSSTPPVV